MQDNQTILAPLTAAL